MDQEAEASAADLAEADSAVAEADLAAAAIEVALADLDTEDITDTEVGIADLTATVTERAVALEAFSE